MRVFFSGENHGVWYAVIYLNLTLKISPGTPRPIITGAELIIAVFPIALHSPPRYETWRHAKLLRKKCVARWSASDLSFSLRCEGARRLSRKRVTVSLFLSHVRFPRWVNEISGIIQTKVARSQTWLGSVGQRPEITPTHFRKERNIPTVCCSLVGYLVRRLYCCAGMHRRVAFYCGHALLRDASQNYAMNAFSFFFLFFFFFLSLVIFCRSNEVGKADYSSFTLEEFFNFGKINATWRLRSIFYELKFLKFVLLSRLLNISNIIIILFSKFSVDLVVYTLAKVLIFSWEFGANKMCTYLLAN